MQADFSIENELSALTCGIDEVGRGPLAGPVVAACVYIPPAARELEFIALIKDSKALKTPVLEQLYNEIREHCIVGVAQIEAPEIDEINILQASLKAIRLSMLNTGKDFEHALIDGNKIPADMPCPATTMVKGDSKSKSIAAASIIAKVTRDRIMHQLHEQHPHYGWDSNVGYPTKLHLDGIDQHGITPHHRKSFKPVRNFLEHGTTKTQPALSA